MTITARDVSWEDLMKEADKNRMMGDKNIEFNYTPSIGKHGYDAIYVQLWKKGSKKPFEISYSLLKFILEAAP